MTSALAKRVAQVAALLGVLLAAATAAYLAAHPS